MHLHDVQHHHNQSPWGAAAESMALERTKFLAMFTQEVMRGPSPLSPGQRELIAAFTSRQRNCLF